MKNPKIKKYRRGKNVIVFTQIEATNTSSNIYRFRVLDNDDLTKYLLDNTKNHIVKEKGLYFAKEALFNLLSFKKRAEKAGFNKTFLEYKKELLDNPRYELFKYLSDEGFIPLDSDIEDILHICKTIHSKTDIAGVELIEAYSMSCTNCESLYEDGEYSVFCDKEAAVESALNFNDWEIKNNALLCPKCAADKRAARDAANTITLILVGNKDTIDISICNIYSIVKDDNYTVTTFGGEVYYCLDFEKVVMGEIELFKGCFSISAKNGYVIVERGSKATHYNNAVEV